MYMLHCCELYAFESPKHTLLSSSTIHFSLFLCNPETINNLFWDFVQDFVLYK